MAELGCPVEEVAVTAPPNALYREDPILAYNSLRPYEEELFKKKR